MKLIYRQGLVSLAGPGTRLPMVGWWSAEWRNTEPAAAVDCEGEKNLKNGRLLNKLRHLNDFNKLN